MGITIGVNADDGAFVTSDFDKKLSINDNEKRIVQHFIDVIRGVYPGSAVTVEQRSNDYISLCCGQGDFLRVKYSDRARWLSVAVCGLDISPDDPRFAAQTKKTARFWKGNVPDLSAISLFDDVAIASYAKNCELQGLFANAEPAPTASAAPQPSFASTPDPAALPNFKKGSVSMSLKTEKFRVAGVSHYVNDIMNELSCENDDYSLRTSELAEIYDVGDRIFKYSFDDARAELVPEPTNEYDQNAIRVEVGGILIGYVKRGSCSHVKNLLKSPDFDHISVEIGGGAYKRLYECDDEIQVERDSYNIFADLYIYTRQADAPEPAAAPVNPSRPDPRPAAPQPSFARTPDPAAPQPKKKHGVARGILVFLGVLFVIAGFASFSASIVSGLFGLAVGGGLLYAGLKRR